MFSFIGDMLSNFILTFDILSDVAGAVILTVYSTYAIINYLAKTNLKYSKYIINILLFSIYMSILIVFVFMFFLPSEEELFFYFIIPFLILGIIETNIVCYYWIFNKIFKISGYINNKIKNLITNINNKRI